MKPNRNFVVLGGAGAIGRIVVRDLFESDRRNRVLVADRDAAAARACARSYASRRVHFAAADASRLRTLAAVLRGHSVVINCTQHTFNLQVMRAALAARTHYIDLGGLFLWTRRQLTLDRQFRRAGLTAIPGMGCAPGITNLLARSAADRLNRISSIRIRVGCKDFNTKSGDFCFPYSAQTIVEELTLNPWIFSAGKFRRIRPRSSWERVAFPPPLGNLSVVLTRHSEIATLPLSFRNRGLRSCDFKVGFERAFVRELVKRLRAGWTAPQFAALPSSRNQPNDYEIARVIASGRRRSDGASVTLILDCHARARPAWHASAGDLDTACPPSIVAQMIAAGRITQRGVLAPEVAVPVEEFFEELRRRGMKIVSDV